MRLDRTLSIVVALTIWMAGIGLAGDETGPTPPHGYAPPTPAAADEDPNAPLPNLVMGNAVASAGQRTLFFIPSDHDGSATCLVFYNTTRSAKTATLQAYNINHVALVNLTITLDPNDPTNPRSRVVACSDSLTASPPPSWQDMPLANFTDFSNFGVVSLPVGVDVDGFVIANGTTGSVDPRNLRDTIELRFDLERSHATSLTFAPSDHDASGTYLGITNTTASTQIVRLSGYTTPGHAAWLNYSIALAPWERRYVGSDSVAALPPPSWATMENANFTDFTFDVVLELPAGVYADGFEIMNGGTGTYDMRAENVEVRKLRFGTNDIFYDGFERGDTNVWSATAP